jgi:protein-disulfide isomerase
MDNDNERTRTRTFVSVLVIAAAIGACDQQRPQGEPTARQKVGAAPTVPRPAALELYRVPLGDSPARGGSAARVTMVVFSEFQCPFCARVTGAVDRVLEAYGQDVRLVWKHRPLPFHDRATPAALAAEAAREQGKFWEMHDRLFANQRALGGPELEAHARALGLDLGRWRAALDSPRTRARLDADAALADQLGVQGTPTFFINGRPLVGAQPFERFKTMVDEEVKKAEALLARGTPRAKLYETLMKDARMPEGGRGL